MKNGIELITEKREEQFEKHHRTIEDDVQFNDKGQLSVGAGILSQKNIPQEIKETLIPKDWDKNLWRKMINKPYKDRLVIAGALLAAEIDRLQANE